MTNAILAAVVVAEDRGNHNATDRQPIISRTEESVAAGSSGERSTVAERKVLALLVRSPAGKLPPSLIDQRTGLAKNNLQAVCRAGPDRSYLCVVRSAQQPWSGLHVRYRPGGNGSLLT